TNSGAPPEIQMRAGFLRFGPENSVAATNVGHYRMRPTGGIPNRDAVFFTWPAAVEIAVAFRQEPAENAVFGVEHGKVLPGDRFYPFRSHGPSQIRHLGGIEIVRGCEAFETELQQRSRRNRVGRVQAEIAGERRMRPVAQQVQQSQRPYQHRTTEPQQKVDDSFFARLEN